MPNTPTTSFIPKQGPVKRTRQTATRQIHLFAILAYMAFATAFIAAIGVSLYKNHIEKQHAEEVNKLNEAIKGFSDADMERVREFDGRLNQTRDRLDNGISIVSVFDALEDATIKSVTLEDLYLKKEEDSSISIAARVSTDSFDSSLFQRGVFERNSVIESVEVSELELVEAGEDETLPAGVSFSAKLSIPASSVPLAADKKEEAPVTVEPVDTVVVATSTASTSAETTSTEETEEPEVTNSNSL
jgi:hypothetical protein